MGKGAVLLIDDDETLLELLADQVAMAGYQPHAACNGSLGMTLFKEVKPDLVVLDVMMPGVDGWQVCRWIREQSEVPVILLTAKNQEFDKLRGFRLGVDDYVTKPFSFAEIVARINAVMSRYRRTPDSALQYSSGELTIDFALRRVTLRNEVIELTPTEYRLLEVLARKANRTVPTERLLTEVWGAEYAGELDHVKHYIWALRKKIEADPGNPRHLVTERGFGYRFE